MLPMLEQSMVRGQLSITFEIAHGLCFLYITRTRAI